MLSVLVGRVTAQKVVKTCVYSRLGAGVQMSGNSRPLFDDKCPQTAGTDRHHRQTSHHRQNRDRTETYRHPPPKI